MKGGDCLLIVRILSYVIDLLLIYLPCYALLTNLAVYNKFAATLSLLLFFVYNVVSLNVFNFQTVGKFFSKTRVYSHDGFKNNLSIYIRELAKISYLLPGIVGVGCLVISIIVYCISGKPLHDLLAQTNVAFISKEMQDGNRTVIRN